MPRGWADQELRAFLRPQGLLGASAAGARSCLTMHQRGPEKHAKGCNGGQEELVWYRYLENEREYLKPFLRAFLVEKHLFPLCCFVALTVFLRDM